jgi:uncharacterized protein YvpB
MRRWRSVSFAMLATILFGMVAMPAPGARALEPLDASVWIEASATRPGVGCVVDISVEIRSEGYGVGQSEVYVAFVVDGEIVSADRDVTSDDGVAWVALDTSGGYAGANGWVDVLIGGDYFTGFSLLPTEDGGCYDGSKLMSTSGTIWYEAVEATADEDSTVTDYSAGFPTYVQQRNLSCEYAAIQIATSAWGNAISEYELDGWVGWSNNPHYGYRGDITGWWGNTYDYGVYAEPLAAVLPSFGYVGDVFYAQGNSDELTWRLDNGIPTLVWLGLWGDTGYYEESDGGSYKLVSGMHVVVAYDYDEGGVYVSDPAVGAIRYYSWGDFLYMWNALDGMGLGVSPS